jgi:biopolymer transport protein ExbD
MAGSAGSSSGEPEFQIAPMIDVLLVLLIFFMSITTTQVLRIDQSINLPVAADAKKRKVDNLNEALVNVDWIARENRAVVRLGNIPCDPPEQLTELLRPMKENNQRLKLIIRGDSDLPALEVQKVIELVAAADIADISLSGLNKK